MSSQIMHDIISIQDFFKEMENYSKSWQLLSITISTWFAKI